MYSTLELYEKNTGTRIIAGGLCCCWRFALSGLELTEVPTVPFLLKSMNGCLLSYLNIGGVGHTSLWRLFVLCDVDPYVLLMDCYVM